MASKIAAKAGISSLINKLHQDRFFPWAAPKPFGNPKFTHL